MNIPNALIDDGLDWYHKDQDYLLALLGEEILKMEGSGIDQQLTGKKLRNKLRLKAETFLEEKKLIFQKAICPKWKDSVEEYTDTSTVLVGITQVIAETLQLSQGYLGLGMIIAVIIIKKGVNKFCSSF